MNGLKLDLRIFSLLFIALCNFSYANAQTNQTEKVQRNYEIMMQTVIGTDNAVEKKNIPTSLSQEINKFKQNYSYKNYELASTSLQRVAEGGSIRYRSLTNDIGSFPEIPTYAIYFNWNFNSIEESKSGSPNDIFIKVFNFDASFPKKRDNLVSYEKVELGIVELNVKANKPNVIGSIAMPQTDETLFFILTVKETNN